MNAWSPLVKITRGTLHGQPLEEASHLGAYAVVDGAGKLVASTGDPDGLVHLRSVAKPFQLLPFLQDGLHEQTVGGEKITSADLALMMSSHSGDDQHVKGVSRLLKMAGLKEDHLHCGAHLPYDLKSRDALIRAGQKPSALHNNCSGKHVAMLMVCQHNGWPLDSYTELSHPLQQRILQIISDQSGLAQGEIGIGIDGCTVPTFILPLQIVAKMYANLHKTLFSAGTSHPDLLGGQRRLDTAIMRAIPGQVFAKTGAEGAFAMGVATSDDYPNGLGIMIKIADGDPLHRARPLVATKILQDLGFLPANRSQWINELAQVAPSAIKNHRGDAVGEIRTVF